MVLAAGLGTRLRPFTDRIPKPLIPLYGIPCMEFALLALKEAGVTETAVNVHAHPEPMRRFIAERNAEGFTISESDETSLLLGSAGGLRKGLSVLGGGPFISMNGDVVHLLPLRQLCSAHQALRARHAVTMTLVLADGPVLQEQTGLYREIKVDRQQGLITGWGEKQSKVPFFTGTAIFEAEALHHLQVGVPAEFVPEVLEPAIREKKVGFIHSDAPWLDLGSPELWHRAETRFREWVREGVLPGALESRVKRADPTLGGRFELGKSSIRMDDIVHEIEDFRNS